MPVAAGPTREVRYNTCRGRTAPCRSIRELRLRYSMHDSDDTRDTRDEQALREAAGRVDERLVLEVAFEPPEALAESVFGLDDAALRQVVALTLARAGIVELVEISLLITGDDGLRDLNREYRARDEVTDVLSFPLLDAPIVEAPEDQLWQPADGHRDGDEAEDDDVLASALAGELAGGAAAETEDTYVEEVFASDDEDIPNGQYGASGSEPEDMPFLTPEEGPLHLGDIAVSREAVERQAAQGGHSPAWELAYLLSHGVLHLVGYDDHTEAGYAAMVTHQEAVLALAGIPR